MNENRQIVAFNSRALNKFKTDNYLDIVGKRLGEALQCIHSSKMEGGCGTSIFCRECGAARAIKETREQKVKAESECRITISNNSKETSLDFFVQTSSIKINNKNYIIFAIRDIASEKRREALEKIFFHDVLNSASVVQGLSELLPEEEDEKQRNEMAGLIFQSSSQLIKEIESQRNLRNAEDGHLEVEMQETSVNGILTSVFDTFKNHKLTEGLNLKLVLAEPDILFLTDKHLLVRSLINLFKNALEASNTGNEILLSAEILPNEVQFKVFNQKVIPEHIQLQLFQRSFSTKANKGRGIGLYSVKLIIEQYMNGKVSFISNEKEKTVFTIALPLSK